ncbi:hypothetical protein AMBAS45_06955 [Alteromonas macleodii str. 'Balearic Sea AD45']|nr:hypothetical protein AMBAS45_06955 [Alteromonas macleodii str. 'Balearic Sea AD45']
MHCIFERDTGLGSVNNTKLSQYRRYMLFNGGLRNGQFVSNKKRSANGKCNMNTTEQLRKGKRD